MTSRCCAPLPLLFSGLELGQPPSTLVLLAAISIALWLLFIHLPTRSKSVGAVPIARSVRILLASLRLAAWVVLLLIAGRLFVSISEPVRPTLVVLLDDSPSMERVDSPADDVNDGRMNRLQIAEWMVRDISATVPDISAENESGEPIVRLIRLSELFPDSTWEDSTLVGSPLGEALIRAVDVTDGPLAGLAFISDGLTTTGPSLSASAERLSRRDIPLFTVAPGPSVPIRRCEISNFSADSPVYVGDVIGLSVHLRTEGLHGRRVAVSLRTDSSDRLLDRRVVTIDDETTAATIPLFYRADRAGAVTFAAEAETIDPSNESGSPPADPLPTVTSETLMRTVQVSDRRIRVLLLFEEPCFEFRFLWNTLFRDASLQVDAVLTGASPEAVATDQPVEGTQQSLRRLPIQAEQLEPYDVIILGDVDPVGLGTSMMQNLAATIDRPGRGAGLLLVAGPRFMPHAYHQTPLARFLPVGPRRSASAGDLDDSSAASPRYTRPLRILPTALGENYPPLRLDDMPSSRDDVPAADDSREESNTIGSEVAGGDDFTSDDSNGDDRDANRSIWNRLPPVYWLADSYDVSPVAQVVAACPQIRDGRGRPIPVICFQYVGAARVVYHATDSTWRWRRGVSDRYFVRYWSQTLRYLARDRLRADIADNDGDSVRPRWTLATDRSVYRRGEPILLTATRESIGADSGAGSSTLVAQLRSSGRMDRRIQLQPTIGRRDRCAAVIEDLPGGMYRATLSDDLSIAQPAAAASDSTAGRSVSVDFQVEAVRPETIPRPIDVEGLAAAARIGGGRFFPYQAEIEDEAVELVGPIRQILDQLRDSKTPQMVVARPLPLWSASGMLLFLFLLLITEWIVRKMVRLP